MRTASGSLAFWPTVFALAALGLAVLVVAVEPDAGPVSQFFPGDPDSARAILGAIAGSTITLAGLVFSITMLVIQLSSSQYSPRVLRTFLTDRNSHLTLATFVGTFTYSVVVLRAIGAHHGRRPVVSVTLAQLLMLVTIGMLVQYVNHITRRMRVSSILASTMRDTVRAVEAESSTGSAAGDPLTWVGGRLVTSAEAGFVAYVDRQALVQVAADGGGRLRLLPRVGDFVAAGEPLFEVWVLDRSDDDQLLRHVRVGDERELEQDPSYGVRQLLDIALRALSPSLNDPTTASQAVDHLRNVLVQVRRLGLGGPAYRDEAGRERLLVPRVGVGELTASTVEELRRAASGQPQVLAAVERLCTGVGEFPPTGVPA